MSVLTVPAGAGLVLSQGCDGCIQSTQHPTSDTTVTQVLKKKKEKNPTANMVMY